MYFAYGEEETDYLKKKDKRMAEVIDRIGHVERKVDTDLFSAVVHHIIGQQISTKAQETIWQRMLSALGEVNAETVLAAGVSKLQSLGMTFRKAEYITVRRPAGQKKKRDAEHGECGTFYGEPEKTRNQDVT